MKLLDYQQHPPPRKEKHRINDNKKVKKALLKKIHRSLKQKSTLEFMIYKMELIRKAL